MILLVHSGDGGCNLPDSRGAVGAFHKKIENRFVRSFLYYVPYACLTAMTIRMCFAPPPTCIRR